MKILRAAIWAVVGTIPAALLAFLPVTGQGIPSGIPDRHLTVRDGTYTLDPESYRPKLTMQKPEPGYEVVLPPDPPKEGDHFTATFIAGQLELKKVPQGDIDPGINHSCPNGDCREVPLSIQSNPCPKGEEQIAEAELGKNDPIIWKFRCVKSAPAVPFDVPPKSVTEDCTDSIIRGDTITAPCPNAPSGSYITRGQKHRYAWTFNGCQDQRRVALTSADGVNHCYAFYLVQP